MNCAHIAWCLFASALLPSLALPAQQGGAPRWRTQLIPWDMYGVERRPWRDDRRLAPHVAPGYPDDFRVLFANPDSARGGRHEIMWVRVIAADSATGEFLGVLLNQPDFLRSVARGDNVVFRAGPKSDLPTAVGAPGYSDAGWPATRAPSFLSTLRDGLRAYRAGNNGHNMPAIERCIEILTPAMSAKPASATREQRFVGHFVLGRCLAEKYETERAVQQFRAAIALDSTDLAAQMALLAELSVMTHQLPGKLPAATEAQWERDFVEQLRVVRARFGRDERVTEVLAMVFDPAQESDLDDVWKPHAAKLRRVGYAVFRWKQR
jgi:hypothetical protein